MVLNPEYYEGFFSSSLGKLLIFVSIIMEATGFFIIKKIIDIKM
jgi:tight adherence protein B